MNQAVWFNATALAQGATYSGGSSLLLPHGGTITPVPTLHTGSFVVGDSINVIAVERPDITWPLEIDHVGSGTDYNIYVKNMQSIDCHIVPGTRLMQGGVGDGWSPDPVGLGVPYSMVNVTSDGFVRGYARYFMFDLLLVGTPGFGMIPDQAGGFVMRG